MDKTYKEFIKKTTSWKSSELPTIGTEHKLYLSFCFTKAYPLWGILVKNDGNIIADGKHFDTLELAKQHLENLCRKLVIGIFKMHNYYMEA